MGKFFRFEKMVTPIIIQIIFWVGFLGSMVSGLFMIGFGIISSSGNFINVFIGIFSLFLGPIIIRIYCEMLIVVFKMQQSLMSIRDLLAEQNKLSEIENDAS